MLPQFEFRTWCHEACKPLLICSIRVVIQWNFQFVLLVTSNTNLWRIRFKFWLMQGITFIRPTKHFPKCNECWTALFYTSSGTFFRWPYTHLRWQMFRNSLANAVLYIKTLHCCIRAKYIFIASNSLSTSTLYPVTYSFRFSFFSCCHV